MTGAGGLSQNLTVSYSNNTNAGTATASANYGGDPNHKGSNDSKTFAIGQASSTTTVTCPGHVTFNGSPQTPCSANVTGAGGLNQSLSVGYSNNTNAGTASASATFAGDANHSGSSGSNTFAIGQASSTTTVTCPAGVTYNGSPQMPCSANVTGAGGLNQSLPVSYSNDTNAGTASASATFAGDANHAGSSDSKTFAISKANPSCGITPYNVIFDGSSHSATGACLGAKGETLSGLDLSKTTHISAGTYTDSWAYTDTTGNYNNASGTVADMIRYRFAGFLQPVNDTAHDTGQTSASGYSISIFKAGSTVPVKFQLLNNAGMPMQALSLPVWMTPIRGSAVTSAVDESVYSDPPSAGGNFRYDSTAQQYIYNWGTSKSQSGYYWKVCAQIEDGTTYCVNIGLR